MARRSPSGRKRLAPGRKRLAPERERLAPGRERLALADLVARMGPTRSGASMAGCSASCRHRAPTVHDHVSDTYAMLRPYDRERPITIAGRPYVHGGVATVELESRDPGGREGP